MSDARPQSMHSDAQYLLIGGENISTWPDLKWARGSNHAATLHAGFHEWSASVPISIEAVPRSDRRHIDFVAQVKSGIPKYLWALALGDCLHNLRAALDAVAWGMAHFDGRVPTRPRSVQFPVCKSPSEWDRAVVNWIGEIPPQLRDRLFAVQPFNLKQGGQPTTLEVLHDLDIRDKHHDILDVSADLPEMSISGAFEFDSGPASADRFELQMDSDARLQDGAVVGTLRADSPIQMRRLVLRPVVSMRVQHSNTTHDLTPLLTRLVFESRGLLDFLYSGTGTPGDR